MKFGPYYLSLIKHFYFRMDTSNEDDYRPPVPPHRNSGTPQPQAPPPPRNSNKVRMIVTIYN